MSKLTLYGTNGSAPVRACLLTLKALNLPFKYVVIDLLKKENLAKEYIAKNPQHTVPTLEDNGKILWDSHAIMAYLVRKYGKNDMLYPKDFYQRAVVDNRLHFESGVVFYGALRNINYGLFFKGEKVIPQHKIDAIIEAYDFLEIFLKNNSYVAGGQLTIADFSILSTVTTLLAYADIDAGKYPKLTAWIQRMKQLPYYQEANGEGVEQLIEMIKSLNFTVVP